MLIFIMRIRPLLIDSVYRFRFKNEMI
jgi:hypothetical protein